MESYKGIKLPRDFLRPDYMVTRDREMLDVRNLKPEEITVAGITRRLAKINRWRGETAHPNSVAYHTLVMYREAIRRGYSRDIRRAVLLHDAHEAFTLDLPRDIKLFDEMKWYRTLCDSVQSKIDEKFNNIAAQAPEVKELDNWAACEEYVELIFPGTNQVLYVQSSWWHDETGLRNAYRDEDITDPPVQFLANGTITGSTKGNGG